MTLGVTDLARARAFYEATGWRGAEQPDDEVCLDVDSVLAEAKRAGGITVRPAARAEWGGVTGGFADPDGYLWEVVHNPEWTIEADGSIKI